MSVLLDSLQVLHHADGLHHPYSEQNSLLTIVVVSFCRSFSEVTKALFSLNSQNAAL